MALYKASVAIPELNKYLLKVGIGEDAIGKYYDKLSHFELNDNQGIEYDTAESILCVLYNIIFRGVPTSASLSLSTSLLHRRFPSNTPACIFKDDREFVITFNPIFTAAFTAEELIAYNNHLINWNEQTAGFVSGELGTNAFLLFSLLEDLRKVAFVQKALVFALFANLRKEKLNVYVDIEDDELASLIVIDTIELLTALCTLSDKQVPYVSYNNEHSVADVIIGTSWGRFENYQQFSKPFLYVNAFPPLFAGNDNGEQQLRQPIASFLSSSKILYQDLGFSVESDDESIPAFEFDNNKRKEALEFLLQNLFRKKDFRPGQLAIINRALQNKDVIGLLPTGGGKSLCFQLCGLLQPGVNLVIDPINSLMKDQYDKLQDYYIGCSGFINSLNNIESEYGTDEGMTLNDVILQRFMDGQLLFLFISPERLLIQKFRNALTSCVSNNNIHYCVIDEAHCVSEWGHDFRIPYLRLADNLRRFCSNHNNAPILFALTATASFDVLADVQREMNLQADSIIALPPGAINRKELTYNIVDLSEHNASLEYPNREFDLSAPKYQKLCELFDQIPVCITKAGTKSPLLDDDLKNSFYTKKDGRYDNAGIIFCTTRSEKLPGGVVSMYDRLSASCDFFEAGTYFAPTDSETVLAAVIDERAHNSGKNQEMFLADKLNLMICTKGFGMGIDKPNLRYTIHYAFPSSVESFYQEAGRAGRDRKKAVCSVLYHPADEQTSLDFMDKAFRGVEKEMTILAELLTEVRYEPKFFLDQLEDFLRAELNYAFRLKLYPANDPTFIYINGPYVENRDRERAFGALRLSDLSHNDRSVKNVTAQQVEKVMDLARSFFRREVPGENYKEWITRTKSDGIRTVLSRQNNEANIDLTLHIGFSNDGLEEIDKLLKPVWTNITKRVIKAGYGFANSPEGFLDNLQYRYAVHLENERNKECKKDNHVFFPRRIKDVISELPSLDATVISDLKGQYYRLRLVNDTQRAIYRFIQVGIIDDYSMDYAKELAIVHFTKKEESTYLNALRVYLRRYLGRNSVVQLVERYADEQLDGFIKPLKIITDFFQNEVKAKRQRGLKLMKELCKLAITKGEEEFKESIVLYFTSKYAKPEYLPEDLENGNSENFAAIRKYLDFLSHPPDELGGEKDNARHLLGACSRMRIGTGKSNQTLNLLHAFAWLAFADQKILAIEKIKLKNTLDEVITAINYFGGELGWRTTIDTFSYFTTKLVNMNADVEDELKPLMEALMEQRLSILLKQINSALKPAFYGAA